MEIKCWHGVKSVGSHPELSTSQPKAVNLNQCV